MNLQEVLAELESLTHERTRALNLKNGIGENQYGVKLGDIRKVAKKVKNKHELALELWETENFDARMLALLIIKPTSLHADELDVMVRAVKHVRVADWINAYVVKVHPDNEALRQKWMKDEDPMASRAGWNLTAIRVVKQPEILDFSALLDRIEGDMLSASEEAQWTMNVCLGEIGIHHPEFRERAIQIGEKLGVYRDYPVSKGCVSPFVPIWVNEMVSRQQK
ncbi:MAG: DNA alkylation repair protein [Bacteroidota bacterium]